MQEQKIKEDSLSAVYTSSLTSSTSKERIYCKHFEKLKKESGEEVQFVILHDLLDHHGRYIHLAPFLFEKIPNCHDIYFVDFKGHGLSSGTRGHIENAQEYVLDTVAFLKQLPHKKTILVGQGLGALVGLKIVADFDDEIKLDIIGFVASNPFLKLESKGSQILDQIHQWRNFFERIHTMRLFHSAEWIGDELRAARYQNDPLVLHRATWKTISEVNQLITDILPLSYFIKVPVLFLVGENDSYGHPQKVELFAKALSREYTRVIKYSSSKHDIFNDIEEDKVLHDIYNWVEQIIF